MIKKNQRYFNWMNRLLDMGIMYLSFVASALFWIVYMGNDLENISLHIALDKPVPVLALCFVFVVVFQYAGMYDSFRFKRLRMELEKLLPLHLFCVMLGVGCIFIFKLSHFSRGVVVCYTVLCYLLLSVKRAGLRWTLAFIRKRGLNLKHILLVGDGPMAAKYIDCIRSNPNFGFNCLGYVGRPGQLEGVKCLGELPDLGGILDQGRMDEVIVALDGQDLAQAEAVIAQCESCGVRTGLIPSYSEHLSDTATVDRIGGVKVLNLRGVSQDLPLNKAVKRSFDLAFAIFAILITSPIMLAIAIGVKVSSPGPVLFKQERVGKERKNFMMYKFRSMRVNDSSATAWTGARDSRVTPFGAFIRKFSLDELPQFFNVLKGEMSVVGPRPELPYFVEQYRDSVPLYMVKHQVKPGLTGWAQVNGYRGDTSIEKRIEHDIWYIENWSLYLDMKIVAMTVFGGMMNQEKNLQLRKEKEHV